MVKISLTSVQKNLLIISGCAAVIVLFAIVGAALVLSVSNKRADDGDVSMTKVAGEDDKQPAIKLFDDGFVEFLSAGTASHSNQKGLTLRINQIDTCNPSRVTAYIAISDNQGKAVSDIKKSDVDVYLDGDKLLDFEFGPIDTWNSPLSSMLLIDHSGTMTEAGLAEVAAAVSAYVDRTKPSDLVGLITFDHLVEVPVPTTSNKESLKKALGKIKPRGNTAVYDAIDKAVNSMSPCGRKAIITLSDGEDTASKASIKEELVKNITKLSVPIYVIGLKNENFNPADIRIVSERSGGQYMQADRPAGLAPLYTVVDDLINSQYAVSFRLPKNKDGSTHSLNVVSDIGGSETASRRAFVY